MEYCFIAGNYPTKDRQVHVFLENIVVRLADRGEKCSVIAPQSSYTYYLKKKNRRPVVDQRTTPEGTVYMVYSPLYFVFPKIKIGKFSMHNWSRARFYKAVERTYKRNSLRADVIYSHFIQAGIAGVKLAEKYGLPSIIANGEADTIDSLKLNNPASIKDTLQKVCGIISVSTKNKNEIKKLSGNDESVMKKVEVIVNAADTDRFYKKDKKKIREKMGWPQDAFVVAFTGSFIERKGVLRLAHVLDRFEDVYSVFMGVGPEKPECKNMLHCGRVNNAELSDYLNAADIFVLPTQAEGCSNAIVEAIACGLPVVSSDREFNYDVLDNTCAVLIDPDSEDEIAEAICKLKNDVDYREKLCHGAQQKASQLSLDVRVDKIQKFIYKIISEEVPHGIQDKGI